MIPVLLLLGFFALVAAVFSISSNARRARESQERLEAHAVSQLPSPQNFDDCDSRVIEAVRKGADLQAMILYRKLNGGEYDAAKARIAELKIALRAGPALGRPPSGLFG